MTTGIIVPLIMVVVFLLGVLYFFIAEFVFDYKNYSHWKRIFKELDGDVDSMELRFGTRNGFHEIDSVETENYSISDIISDDIVIRRITMTDHIISHNGSVKSIGRKSRDMIMRKDTLLENRLRGKIVKKLRDKTHDIALLKDM